MKRCIKLVTAKGTGAGVQTITSINDADDGLPFVGKFGWVIAGFLTNGTFVPWFNFDHGFDDGTTHFGSGAGEIEQFGSRIASGGSGNRSILDVSGNAFFGGDIFRKAYISAFRSGEADITYDTNDRTGDVFLLVILGGDDLSVQLGTGALGANATGFEPKGVLFKDNTVTATSPVVSGGAYPYFGFAAVDGNAGDLAIGMDSPGFVNGRYQRIDKAASTLVAGGPVLGNEVTVSAWGATSFTLAGAALNPPYAAFGGDEIRAACGNGTQPVTTGAFNVETGIACKIFVAASFGKVAGTTVDTGEIEVAIGFFDGHNQACYWGGESAGALPLNGAKYLNNTNLLVFSTPAAGASVVNSHLTGVSISSASGRVGLNWDAVDGTQRQWFWFALGTGVGPSAGVKKSGIYKLTPGKKNDTLYTAFDPEVEVDFKIPDPNIVTALFGDEP